MTGLDGREIIPNDLSLRRDVRKVDGPNACPCTEIYNSLGTFDGGQKQVVVEKKHHFRVGQVHAILFLFIVGEEVSP